MAINTFTFGGITSSTYGIYVSGEGLFNAPKRDAEVVQIPGRDGDYILDKGSFENIEVTYRVFNQEKDLTDFRTKLANLRSALCSKTGYQRLTDTFHPNEYRMAAFIDGIEINPVKYNTASEFEIKFNCKPQRFLTSGETATAVTSGGKVTNPTLFDAKPQLQVWGGGAINIGNQQIVVDGNTPIGDVQVANTKAFSNLLTYNFTFDDQYANIGDTLTIQSGTNAGYFTGLWDLDFDYGSEVQSRTITKSGDVNDFSALAGGSVGISLNATNIVYGTSRTITCSVSYDYVTISYGTQNITIGCTFSYDGVKTITLTGTVLTTSMAHVTNTSLQLNAIILHSTQYSLGNPIYIDLDIGEAYKIENGSTVSVNNAVSIPAELPTLPPGDTTFTYDNTITQFKVLPRWWKV